MTEVEVRGDDTTVNVEQPKPDEPVEADDDKDGDGE